MAGLTGRTCFCVYTVAEVNKGREFVNSYPGNGLLVFQRGGQGFDMGTFSFYRLVAAHTKAFWRQPHGFTRIGVFVARIALQPYSQMGFVAVGDGLFNGVKCSRRENE